MFVASFVFDRRTFPFQRPDLYSQFELATRLQRAQIIDAVHQVRSFPDEPRLRLWTARYNDQARQLAGGSDAEDDAQALTAALAEALERYLWFTATDYYDAPVRATEKEIAKKGAYTPVAFFAGFSEKQRLENPKRELSNDTAFLWIRGYSLVSGKKTYVPAQTVSAAQRWFTTHKEPVIRPDITTGLATWTTLVGARVRGALEVIERDAFMIMWLNQLTLPRINLAPVRAGNKKIARLIDSCERYHFKIHAVRLLTDAPAHAICAVVEDVTGHAPRYSFGIRAAQTLDHAIESAIIEALRARDRYRREFSSKSKWDPKTKAADIGHTERIYYWGVGDRWKRLSFICAGTLEEPESTPWQNDSESEYLERIAQWCRKEKYECVSVSLGKSKKNPTSLSVETVVIPQLQPIYILEHMQTLGGMRIRDVPQKFGYTPRSEPFHEEPQPFA
jgi:ribosomal protein S12 methylthiotransferase accessory factor